MERVENNADTSSKETDETSLVPVPRPILKVPLQRPSLLECMPSGVSSIVMQGQPVIVLNVNNSLDPLFNLPTFTLGQQSNSFCNEKMKLLQGSIQHYLPMLTNSVTMQTKGIPRQLPMVMSAEQHDTEPKIVPIPDDLVCVDDNNVASVSENGAGVRKVTAHSEANQLVLDEMIACGEKHSEVIRSSSQLNESEHFNEVSQDSPCCCSPPLLSSPVQISVEPDSRLPSSPDRGFNYRIDTPDLSDHCTNQAAPVIPVGGTIPNGLGLLTQEIKEVIQMEDSDNELDLPETNGSDVQLFTPAPNLQSSASACDCPQQVCTLEEGSLVSQFLPISQTESSDSSIPNGQGPGPSGDILSLPSPASSETRQDEDESCINPVSHPSHSGLTVCNMKAGTDDIPTSSCCMGETIPIRELNPFSTFTAYGFQSTSLPASPLQANAQAAADKVSPSTSISVVSVSSCSKRLGSPAISNNDVLTEDSCSVVSNASSEQIPKTPLILSDLQISQTKRESGSCTSSVCDVSSVSMAAELSHIAHQSVSQDLSFMQTVSGDNELYMSSHVSTGALAPVLDDFDASPPLSQANVYGASSSINSIEKGNLKRQATLEDSLSLPLPKKPLTVMCTNYVQQDQTLSEDLICKNDGGIDRQGDSTFCEEDDDLFDPLFPQNECHREPIEIADDGRETLDAALPSSAELSTSQQFSNNCQDSDSDDPGDDSDHGFGTCTAGISTETIKPDDTVPSHYCSIAVPTNEVEEGSGDLYLYPETPKVRNNQIPVPSSFNNEGTRHNSKMQEFPHRPLYIFSSATCFGASDVCRTSHVKPRLRMGLSKRQKVQPLHQQSIYRKM